MPFRAACTAGFVRIRKTTRTLLYTEAFIFHRAFLFDPFGEMIYRLLSRLRPTHLYVETDRLSRFDFQIVQIRSVDVRCHVARFSDDRVCLIARLTRSSRVNGSHLEHVRFAFYQIRYRSYGFVCWHRQRFFPRARFIFDLYYIACDGGSAVFNRRYPFQINEVLIPIGHFQVARFARLV